MKKIIILILLWLPGSIVAASGQQTGAVKGVITAADGPVVGATVQVENTTFATAAGPEGHYQLTGLPAGQQTLIIKAMGYRSFTTPITITPGKELELDITLHPDQLGLEEVVVSATRYGVSRKEAPVIVSVLGPKLFNATQSMSLSEGLAFQPGVRVETNCQNCGFTQVRLNGLEGGYSQILIDNRAVFSALSSVYGLDQIPANMIERVEVVRSGGSALFGSNAIAGTINIITKDPVENTWQIGSNMALTDGTQPDNTLNFNGSLVSEDLRSGVTFYGMMRNRHPFDVNGDGFTEITRMENNTFGGKAFFRPTELSKLTLDFSAVKEFRRGGDRLDLAPHFTDITEQLEHQMLIGGLTYDQFSRDQKNKYSAYASVQTTRRDSYYGGLGGGRTVEDTLAASNAYGITDDLSLVGGVQFTRNFASADILTAGAEYQHSGVDDEIAGYGRLIDQQVGTVGLYAQYEWKLTPGITALLGARYDRVQVSGSYHIYDVARSAEVTAGVASPRITLLTDLTPDLQFRGGYASGFRAPQAFNEDMHVSSVGGEPRFVILSESLETERSDAYTASLNYTRSFGLAQISLLAEGFHTYLKNPFVTVGTGSELAGGALLEEVRNGKGAYVSGVNLELGFSPSAAYNFQLGGTFQRSRYREAQVIFAPDDDDEAAVSVNEFTRTPDLYGYLNGSWTPGKAFSLDVSGLYTGAMTVPHIRSASGTPDLVSTDPFVEMNLKAAWKLAVRENFTLELSGGLQNVFNSYQQDFDTGAGRDSDYIYGPSRPRTFFLGLKVGNFL